MIGRLEKFHNALLAWYDVQRRDLPWRVPLGSSLHRRPEAYHVLVSEAMLQQTQVATVIPYFLRFLRRFPTLEDLAKAPEQEVLRLWQGLGYYLRARNLRKAAQAILERHNGVVPSTVQELLELPGIGRYTAGAIASIAHEQRVAILDGNVIRVLCRIDKVRHDPRTVAVREKLWDRAAQILPDARVGDFNSALMELGATVCTPREPACLLCPVQRHCEARAAGTQRTIPPAAPAKARPVEQRWTFCIASDDRWLIEQRPATGRWAGLWQFVTCAAGAVHPTAAQVRKLIGLPMGLSISRLSKLGKVRHDLTHRRYEFEVFRCQVSSRTSPRTSQNTGRVWASLAELNTYPLPRPHLKVAELLVKH